MWALAAEMVTAWNEDGRKNDIPALEAAVRQDNP